HPERAENSHQPRELLEAEELRARQPEVVRLGHAVAAAQIAAVGDTQAQVAEWPAEGVAQGHGRSVGGECHRQRKTDRLKRPSAHLPHYAPLRRTGPPPTGGRLSAEAPLAEGALRSRRLFFGESRGAEQAHRLPFAYPGGSLVGAVRSALERRCGPAGPFLGGLTAWSWTRFGLPLTLLTTSCCSCSTGGPAWWRRWRASRRRVSFPSTCRVGSEPFSSAFWRPTPGPSPLPPSGPSSRR